MAQKDQNYKESFHDILSNILEQDYEKILESKIFEEEIGCWVRENNNTKYPLRIHKQFDEPILENIKEFEDVIVKYYFLNQLVEKLPNSNIVLQHKHPHKICQVHIYEKNWSKSLHPVAIYNYYFSSRIINKQGINYDSVNKLLYYLVKKNKN